MGRKKNDFVEAQEKFREGIHEELVEKRAEAERLRSRCKTLENERNMLADIVDLVGVCDCGCCDGCTSGLYNEYRRWKNEYDAAIAFKFIDAVHKEFNVNERITANEHQKTQD